MFSLTMLIATGAITFVVGCLLGALLSRVASPEEKKSRSLETRLQETEKQLSDYQEQVTEHFAKTAELVNNLTQNYRDVHEHLAGSALQLANVDISRQLLTDMDNHESSKLDEPHSESDVQPPKDWAPKSPGSEGMLHEGYGLHEEQEKPAGMVK